MRNRFAPRRSTGRGLPGTGTGTRPPSGDPVEIWVNWSAGDEQRHVKIEQLLFDKRTNRPMPAGPWVYTGSSFLGQRYLAELDGVLIGFAHSPSPIIENPRAGTVGAYGSVVLNRDVMAPGTPVTLLVKAIGPTQSDAAKHPQ